MAFDETLAARIRRVLADRADVVELRMFGGLAFMAKAAPATGRSTTARTKRPARTRR